MFHALGLGIVFNFPGKSVPTSALVHSGTISIMALLLADWLAQVLGGILQLVSLLTLAHIRGSASAVDALRIAIGHAHAFFVLVELQTTLTHIRSDTTAISTAIALWDAAGRQEEGEE